MTMFDTTRPAILQLSDLTTAYIIDLVELANNPALEKVLTEIFMHSNTVCVGFAFKNDLDMLGKFLPEMSFYRRVFHFIDLSAFYFKSTQKPVQTPQAG